MLRKLKQTSVAAVAAFTAMASQAPAQAPASDVGDVSRGQALYYEHACYACHGYGGETGARALVGSGFLLNAEVFTIFLRLRAEQNPILPSTQMPNYPEASLSDSEALDLYTFVKTFESNDPALEDIPALNAILDAAQRSYEP